ncbi:hypothetical protein RAM19_09520 [Bartonella apihabitans]|nr:hypothetical protein [Bartonella apihabitans]WLT08294.1 hypothetical protein RAM19_09520 [Bartonella apihabitans]
MPIAFKMQRMTKRIFQQHFHSKQGSGFQTVLVFYPLTGFGGLWWGAKLTLIGKIQNFFGVKAQKRSRTRQESPV